MRLALAVGLALLAPAPAIAQISIEPARPATTEEISAARMEVDRLISEAGAGDVFDNVSEGREARARHRSSGMICQFQLGEAGNRIVVYPAGPRGDDVACSTPAGTTVRTVYATRWEGANPTPEQIIAAAAYSIEQRNPAARPYEEPVVTANITGASPTLIAAYSVPEGYTHAMIAHVDDWSIKERLTLPAAPTMEEQVWRLLTWSMLVSPVVEAQGD